MARVKVAALAVLLAVALAGCESSAPPQITVGAAKACVVVALLAAAVFG